MFALYGTSHKLDVDGRFTSICSQSFICRHILGHLQIDMLIVGEVYVPARYICSGRLRAPY